MPSDPLVWGATPIFFNIEHWTSISDVINMTLAGHQKPLLSEAKCQTKSGSSLGMLHAGHLVKE